ncbi:O-antigen ligase [Desulfobotulus alkaliphilus]|uniref:O-antigen ligase n=1 Tax=Desulfobotulus alkaliphilus TaxID=622671 RepID=A0A562RGK9_9BACT|nr:O-antigen ligase family protein [Desulfobotulus alkaliphilus]TWI68201.1 O-antigen ligase [Desulfobotulus alkaliphilus]
MDVKYKLAWFIYVFSLIFAPLAFGTTEEWSFFLVYIMMGFSFILFMIHAWKEKVVLYRVPGTAFFLAGFIYSLTQLLPMPAFLVRILSPASHAIREDVFRMAGDPGWYSLSLHPEGGLVVLSQLVLFYLVYYLSIQFFTDFRILKRTLAILAIFAGLLSISTILQSVFTEDMALWFRYVPHNSMVFGPYVNHNHYAGLMEMLLPLVLALYLIYRPVIMKPTLREKILGFLERDSSYKYVLHIFFVILIMLSVFMSLSRTGIAAMMASLVLFALLVRKYSRKRKEFGGTWIFLFVLTLVSLSWYGWSQLDVRFGQTITQLANDGVSRLTFWEDTTRIIRDFPLTGSGGGSFEQIHPVYQNYYMSRLAGYAHNDYLELLSDFGVIGFVLFFAFLSAVLISMVRKLPLRKEKFSLYGSAAVFAGLFAIALHSIMDFNLQIPANAIIFMVILALGISFANTRFREHLEPTYLPPAGSRTLLVYALVFCLCWPVLGIYSGRAAFAKMDALKLPQERVNMAELDAERLGKYAKAAGKAYSVNPHNASYAAAVGDAFLFYRDYGNAIDWYEKSLTLNPLAADVIQKMGLAAYYTGNREAGEYYLQLGVAMRPWDILMYQRLAAFYLETRNREKGIETVKKALALQPSAAGKLLEIMGRAGMSFTDMARSMPEVSEAWNRYYLYVRNSGHGTDYPLEVLERGLVHARSETLPSRNLYIHLSREYQNRNRLEDAYDIMQEALGIFSEDAGVLYHAGFISERLHFYQRAEEYYKRSLLINPSMASSKRRLDALQGK